MATRADSDDVRSGLSGEEALALVLAVAAHGALLAAFTLAPPGRTVQPPPERMTVTIADSVADKALSPEPQAQAAPDLAPTLGEAEPQPAPPVPVPPKPQPPQPQPPKPEPPKPQPPKPQPAPPRPQPAPVKPAPAKPQPAPPKPQAAPAKPAPPKPVPAKPAPAKAAAAPARPEAAAQPRRPANVPTGGSRISSDFLHGIPASTNPGTARTPPAAAVGPAPVAALVSAISRQIKPRWSAPQGVDTDKLVTVLSWNLNPDGSLAGRPVVVSQSGITDENRAQAQRHAEQAIRAVQLAAPFDLPPEFYSSWKRVAQFRFDRKLSQ